MLPLVIIAGPRALPTAALSSRYYARSGSAAIVVRPGGCAEQDTRFASGTRFIDDEALAGVENVGRFLRERAEFLATFHRSPGWFLQQFIKFAVVAAIGAPFVFIADGDTIFANDLLDVVLKNPTILTTGEKFENYDRLVRAIGLNPPSSSCVANGNVFSQAAIVRELATPTGYCSFLEEHVFASGGRLDLSEYQITGSLLEPDLGSRKIRIFRRYDLLVEDIEKLPERNVVKALGRYDAIAIEANHHRSASKRLAAHMFYMVGKSW